MGKIKVLFLAANPLSSTSLALDEEIRAIDEKIRAAEFRETLELVRALATRPEDLQSILLRHQPHIVHFSGHGTTNAELILSDHNGQPVPVSKNALVGLLRASRTISAW